MTPAELRGLLEKATEQEAYSASLGLRGRDRETNVLEQAMRAALPALLECVEALETVRDGFDCDSDAHKYGTACRCCIAAAALSALEAVK